MKLYTEEQVMDIVRLTLEDAEKSVIWSKEWYPKKLGERLIQSLTPIELPSDEEILVPFPTEKDENFRDGKEIKMWMNGWENGYKELLQSLRNKIKGDK